MYNQVSHELGRRRWRRRTFGDGQSWRPLVTQDVQANAAVAIDVGVVDAGGEVDLGRLEGVVCGEVNGEEKYTSGVGRVTLDGSTWSAADSVHEAISNQDRRCHGSMNGSIGKHYAGWSVSMLGCRRNVSTEQKTYGTHDCRLPVKLLNANHVSKYCLHNWSMPSYRTWHAE